MLSDTKFEYQNRMVKWEWLPIFKRAGLEIASYFPNITDESRLAVTYQEVVPSRREGEADVATRQSPYQGREQPCIRMIARP